MLVIVDGVVWIALFSTLNAGGAQPLCHVCHVHYTTVQAQARTAEIQASEIHEKSVAEPQRSLNAVGVCRC